MDKIRNFKLFAIVVSISLVLSLGPGFLWADIDTFGPEDQRMADAARAASENGDTDLTEDLAYLVQEAENIVANEGQDVEENVAVPIVEDSVIGATDAEESAQASAESESESTTDGSAETSSVDTASNTENSADVASATGDTSEEGNEGEAGNGTSTAEAVAEAGEGEAEDTEEDSEASSSEDVTEGPWLIGKKQYETLVAAVEAAEDGSTITLTADVAESSATLIEGKTLTIDLNGYTVSGANIDRDPLIRTRDAKLTISNGTVRDCVASYAWNGYWFDYGAGVIAADNTDLTVNNVTFIDNAETTNTTNTANDIVMNYGQIQVNNCVFQHTHFIDGHAAIKGFWTEAVVDNTQFIDLNKALQFTNYNQIVISNSTFSGFMPEGNKGSYEGYVQITPARDNGQEASIVNCTFDGITMRSDNYFTEILNLDARDDAKFYIKGCTFTNNSVVDGSGNQTHHIVTCRNTYGVSRVDLTIEDTLFKDNESNMGTLYLGSKYYTVLDNTVIKDNVARGYASRTEFAGGIIHAGKDLRMNNSAVYNNTVLLQSDFSPAKAEDVYIWKNSQINAPTPSEFIDFTDSGFDFSDYVWKDGAVSGFEMTPALTLSNERFYTITEKSGLSVARIGETVYESLEDAFAAATEGDTIEVIAEAIKVSVKEPIVVGKNLTLALEDHNVLYAGTGAFLTIQDGATLTITNVQSERYNINSNATTDVEGGIEAGKVVVEDGGKLVLADPMLTNGIENNGELVFDAVQKKAAVALGKGKFVQLGEAYASTTDRESKLSLILAEEVLAGLNDGTSPDVVLASGGSEALFNGITVAGLTNSAVMKKMVGENIVLHIGEALYLSGAGSDSADGTTAATAVKTFAEVEKRIADNPKIDTIIVCGTVPVASEQTWQLPEGAVMVRDVNFKESLVMVANGGALTLENIVFDGMLLDAAAPLITVDKGGALAIQPGTVLKNNLNRANNLRFGGAIHTKGTVTMEGGTICANEATHGGGVCVYGESATFDFTGGSITRNAAVNSRGDINGVGGGVCVTYGATFTMGPKAEASASATKSKRLLGATATAVPEITNNTASRSGGGVSVGTSAPLRGQAPGVFIMNGGLIDGNSAVHTGGGIFIQDSNEGYVYAGTITNNKAYGSSSHFAGGGIYVNGLHATASWTPHVYNSDFAADEQGFTHGYLYIENVEITGNTADWSGGAIAGCITSQDLVGEGATAIHDNTSNNSGPTWSKYSSEGTVEVFHSYKSWWEDVFLNRAPHAPGYLSKYMIGGGEYNWYYVASGETPSTDVLYKNTTYLAVTTDATAGDEAVERARAGAKVLIANNYSASCGGGIGTNGVVEIGKIAPKVDVSVKKAWAGEPEKEAAEEATESDAATTNTGTGEADTSKRPTSLKFQLLRAEGEEAQAAVIDEVVVEADEDGNFTYTWKDLIKHVIGSNEGTEYIYTVAEDLDYVAKNAAGEDVKIGDYYKAQAIRGEDGVREVEVPTTGEAYDVVSQAIQTWIITNTYTEPEEPTEPEKPTEPEEPPTDNPPVVEEPPTVNNPPVVEEPPTVNNPPTVEEPPTVDNPSAPEKPTTPATPTPATPTKTVTGQVKTGDAAPIIPLVLGALLAAGVMSLALRMHRRLED